MLNYSSASVVSPFQTIFMCVQEDNSKGRLHLCLFFVNYFFICLDNRMHFSKLLFLLQLLLKFVKVAAAFLPDRLSVRYSDCILSVPLIITCSNNPCSFAFYTQVNNWEHLHPCTFCFILQEQTKNR